MTEANFAFTGAEVSWVVPDGVTQISIDMAGGQGGSGVLAAGGTYAGGRGARVQATLTVTPGETLYIGVGGRGDDGEANNNAKPAKFFGGGGKNVGTAGGSQNRGGMGGGASYIKKGGAVAPDNIILVAGGGGGGNAYLQTQGTSVGGPGGPTFQSQSSGYSPTGEFAPSPVSNSGNAGSGGGGWQGGRAGDNSNTQTTGGTSMRRTTAPFVGTPTNATGVRTGDGYVTFTYFSSGGGGTTASTFYTAAAAEADASVGGTDIRALRDTVQTGSSNTVLTYTAAATKVIDPHTSTGNGGNSLSLGWAVRQTDGGTFMGSVDGARRFINAGTWTVVVPVSYNAPALLGSYDITARTNLYRVSAADSKTLILQSGLSNTITASVSAGSGDLTMTFNPGLLIFGAGETFMISIQVTSSNSTALVVGASTTTTLTFTTGTADGIRVTIPSPGIRTLYEREQPDENAASDLGEPVRVFEGARTIAEDAPALDTQARYFEGVRSLTELATALDEPTRRTMQYRRPNDELAPAQEDGAPVRVFQGYRNIPESAPAEHDPERIYVGIRQIMDNGPAEDEPTRRTTQYRRPDDEFAPADINTPVRVFIGARNISETSPADNDPTRVFIGSRMITDEATADDNTTRRTTQRRSVTNDAPAKGLQGKFGTPSDGVSRVYQGYRNITDNAPAEGANPERMFIGSRMVMDGAAAEDDATRRFTGNRSTDFEAPADDTATRVVQFYRDTDFDAPAVEVDIVRVFQGYRNINEDAPADITNERIITYGRNITEGPADIIVFPTREITGVVYDPDGLPYEGAEVWLIRLSDDRHIRTTFSDANGIYQFDRDQFDNQSYMVYGYTDILGIEHADVSDRDLEAVVIGTVTPGEPLPGGNPNLYLVPQELGSGGGTTVIKKIFPVFS